MAIKAHFNFSEMVNSQFKYFNNFRIYVYEDGLVRFATKVQNPLIITYDEIMNINR